MNTIYIFSYISSVYRLGLKEKSFWVLCKNILRWLEAKSSRLTRNNLSLSKNFALNWQNKLVWLECAFTLAFTAFLCRGGEIGRHASFRCWWGQPRGGSNPLLGTIYILAKNCNNFRYDHPHHWLGSSLVSCRLSTKISANSTTTSCILHETWRVGIIFIPPLPR